MLIGTLAIVILQGFDIKDNSKEIRQLNYNLQSLTTSFHIERMENKRMNQPEKYPEIEELKQQVKACSDIELLKTIVLDLIDKYNVGGHR